MSTKEIQLQIVDNMRKWQKIEDAAVATTGAVLEKTNNPVVHLIMEIVQRDSQMHYQVQGWIADSLESKTVTLTYEELDQIWGLIEKHIELEKKTLEMAKQSLEALKGKKMVLQEYLLNYLSEDEEKHNNLLAHLEGIKKGMRAPG